MPSSDEILRAPRLLADRPLQFRGSRLAAWLLRRWGWQLVFDGLPGPQGLLIAYPHTSNWDFVVGILAKWALGLKVSFWGKDSLFRLPLFGAWLRWVGGVPVDRFNAHGVVAGMGQRFRQARQSGQFLWLALAPEGTREYVAQWRSGFYPLALAAQVPVGLVFLDHGRKRVGMSRFLMLGGEPEADMAAIAQAYEGVIGRRPDQAAPIRLRQG